MKKQTNHGFLKSGGKGLLRLFLVLQALAVLYPLIWNVLASLKTNKEILGNPWALPASFEWSNFVRAFTTAKIGYYVGNSILVTALSLLLLLVIAVPSAYAIGRFDFMGRKIIHQLYLMGLFISPIYIIVPQFLLLNELHMLDNRFWLSLIYATGSLPFSIYLLTGFMKGIPKDYEQSAMIDGCGYTSTLVRIVVPLAKPGIVTLMVFSFFQYWNEYVMATVYVTSEEKKTIPLGLANLMEVQRFATDWGALFAGLVIVLVPTIVLYALTQKKLSEGLSLGGLKG